MSVRFVLLISMILAACSSPVAAPTHSAPPTTGAPTGTPATLGTAAPSPTASSAAGTLTPTAEPVPNTALISAPSTNVVWVLVGGVALFRSTDRGATWEQRPVPSTGGQRLDSVSFVNEREGWIAYLGPPTPGCGVQDHRLWHTSDAGASYEPLPWAGMPDQGCRGPVSFVDDQLGFASIGSEGSAPTIYRTTNGGRSWSPSAPVPGRAGATVFLTGVKRFGIELLFLLWREEAGEVFQIVYGSSDGGASWSGRGSVVGGSPLTLVTTTRWLMLGPPGEHNETTDAATSWHPFESDYQQAAPDPPAVTFADEQVGYAKVRGSIQRTTDGGAHWTRLKTPGTD